LCLLTTNGKLLKPGGKKILKALLSGMENEIDEDSFIQDQENGNKELAEHLAKTENVSSMSEEHWKLVNYLRDYYIKFGIAAPIRMVVKQTWFDLKYIYKSFPGIKLKVPVTEQGYPNLWVVSERYIGHIDY